MLSNPHPLKFRLWVPLRASLMCLLIHVVLHQGLGYAGEMFRLVETPAMNLALKDARINKPILISERASSAMVGTIMALLATFDDAEILPPEGTAQANQVIHALIQFQSAFLKSSSLEIAGYWAAAKADWENRHEETESMLKREEGLTERVLAVLIAYDQKYPLWEEPNIDSAFQAFNVTRADWMLVVELYRKAKAVFHEQGRSIEVVYKNWKMKVPGGKF